MRRLVLAAFLVLVATSAAAAMPWPPFDVRLSSTSLTEGETVTIRLAARPGVTDQQRYDVYLLLASVEEAAFITPEGTWARRPVPYARSISTADTPIVRQWPRVWPPGRFALGVVVVPPSGDPLARAEWRYRPAITWFKVTPLDRGEARPALGMPALLGVAAVVAVVLVWSASRPCVMASGP